MVLNGGGMKLTIERGALLKALSHAQSVVERRNTIPILANVRLECTDGRLMVAATDMDLGVQEEVPANVEAEGATTAPAHTLHDIARKLPDGAQVALDASEGGQLQLRSGRSLFTLQTLPVDEFPVLANGDLPHRFRMSARDLRSLIDRTRFAISTEETRYYLNGIYLHRAEHDGVPVLRAVATDGHRLALVETPLPEGATELPGVIVPRKTVNEIHKLLDEESADVEVSLSETKIRFAFDHVVLTSKLIDGTFPDYERVIPRGNDRILEVDCRQFSAAVDRVATISTEKTRAVKLGLGNNILTLTATSADSGTANEELEVSYASPPFEIGFNSRYLLEISQQIEGDVAEVALADPASPTVVRDKSDSSALYVLMPMRV